MRVMLFLEKHSEQFQLGYNTDLDPKAAQSNFR